MTQNDTAPVMRKRIAIPLFMALWLVTLFGMLTGCAQLQQAPATVQTTLSSTKLDEQAVALGYIALDGAADEIKRRRVAGLIVPDTPQAIRLAAQLRTARLALGAADDARRAGQASSTADAVSRATAALEAIQALLKGKGP